MSDASFAKLQESVNGLSKAVDDLIRDNQDLMEALTGLANEISGIWRIAEYAMRQEVGNTNYQCLVDKLVAARKVVARIEGARQ